MFTCGTVCLSLVFVPVAALLVALYVASLKEPPLVVELKVNPGGEGVLDWQDTVYDAHAFAKLWGRYREYG